MMKTKIIYFDHDDEVRETVVNLLQNDERIHNSFELKVLPHENDKKAIEKDISDTDDIVMVHMYKEQFESLLKPTDKNVGKVRLRVSTQGFQNRSSCAGGVSCLYLRLNHEKMKSDDWYAVLKAISTPEILNKIVTDDVPPELHKYFGEPLKGEILALSILCQGYLTAWACSKGLLDSGLSKIDNLMKEALEKMGFDKICERKGDLAAVLEKAKEKFTDEDGGVKQAKWWQIFEPKASQVINEEMKACGILETEFGKVVNLATWIDTGNGTDFSPELVANAYLEIKTQENKLAS